MGTSMMWERKICNKDRSRDGNGIVKNDQKDNDDKGNKAQDGSKIIAKPKQNGLDIGQNNWVAEDKNCKPFDCLNLECGRAGFEMKNIC